MGSSELHQLAIDTGFCQRTSPLAPEVFFDLLFYAVSLSQNSSLEYLVSYLDTQYGIQIRKQSLDARFTERTVDFVKAVLSRLLSEQFSGMLFSADFLSPYHHVRVKDSTTFKVPSHLANHYKGRGDTAGISIQYEFDLKTGKFLDLTLNEAVRNDQRDAQETTDSIGKDDLIIRDLGYFSTGVLKTIVEKEAYFLSRLQSATGVYDKKGVEVDFKELYTFMTKNGIEKCEQKVFIGKDRLAVRLAIGIVPPSVYEQRVRRKEKEEKQRGCQMKDRTRFLLHFNLFVTNVEAEKLPMENILPLYRFRWQIELMFKNWKSVFSIHKLQKMKENRYITMLYTRLILIVVNLRISNQVQCTLTGQGSLQKEKNTLLSYRKTSQTLKNCFSEVLKILRCSKEEAIKLLGELYQTLSKNHWREKRKNRENFMENIGLFICISEK